MPIENLWVIDSRYLGILWRCGFGGAAAAGAALFSPRPRLALLLAGVGLQRLGGLGAVAVDRESLEALLPAVAVGVGDVGDRLRLRQVDRLRDRAREERLRRGHHVDVAGVRDGALADRHVEDLEV